MGISSQSRMMRGKKLTSTIITQVSWCSIRNVLPVTYCVSYYRGEHANDDLFTSLSQPSTAWQSKSQISMPHSCLSAVQVYGEEWSFGQCSSGSRVFSIRPKSHSHYTFRETLVLGRSSLDRTSVTLLLAKLRRDWIGASYHLLTRNCNHFGDLLCGCLGVGHLPCTSGDRGASGF